MEKTRSCGRYFNLQEIFDKLNREYFNGIIQGSIVWGRRKAKSRRIQKFGRYAVNHLDRKLIIVNRVLDRSFVPRYFVEYIVYHEMLHQSVVIYKKNGRWQYHSPTFLVEEKKFKCYAQAKRWDIENQDRLSRY